MAFRVQPPEIVVPEDDPFRNDLLGRRPSIEPWGTGKTTFFKMWCQHLRNDGFFVAEFNAWETDITADPLLALSTELLDGLDELPDESLQPKLRKLRDDVPNILKTVAPSVIGAATRGFVDIKSWLEPTERISQYRKAVELFRGFRRDLRAIASSVSEPRSGRPLIVLIDELDRCRPPYAVELLKVAKHVFASRHVVFALALNRNELEHSVQALYGSGFDAHGYLRRFFDIDYRLPDPERHALIGATLERTGISDPGSCDRGRGARPGGWP